MKCQRMERVEVYNKARRREGGKRFASFGGGRYGRTRRDEASRPTD
jgi:hypothetical protein